MWVTSDDHSRLGVTIELTLEEAAELLEELGSYATLLGIQGHKLREFMLEIEKRGLIQRHTKRATP